MLPSLVARHAIEVRLRQTLALLGRERERRSCSRGCSCELLRQLGEPLGDRLEAIALLRRQRHAAVFERFEQILLQLLLRVRARHDAAHALVELLVLKELGHEDRLFDQRAVAGIAHARHRDGRC